MRTRHDHQSTVIFGNVAQRNPAGLNRHRLVGAIFAVPLATIDEISQRCVTRFKREHVQSISALGVVSLVTHGANDEPVFFIAT